LVRCIPIPRFWLSRIIGAIGILYACFRVSIWGGDPPWVWFTVVFFSRYKSHSLLINWIMNISGATEKILSKENLKQLISSKHASVTFSKDISLDFVAPSISDAFPEYMFQSASRSEKRLISEAIPICTFSKLQF